MGALGAEGKLVLVFGNLTTEELNNFCHMSVLQMVTVFSTALHRSWLVWTVFTGRDMLSQLNSALTTYLLGDVLQSTDNLQFILSSEHHLPCPFLLFHYLFL